MCCDKVGQHRLGHTGACKAAVQFLSRYERHDLYASLFCSVIAALAYKSPDNQSRLSQFGACKVVVGVMERFLGTSLETYFSSRGDLTNGSNISPSSSSTSLSSLATQQSLNQATGRPSLVIDGCAAIAQLSLGHEVNRNKLTMASPTIVDVLTAIVTAGPIVSDLAKENARCAMDAIVG